MVTDTCCQCAQQSQAQPANRNVGHPLIVRICNSVLACWVALLGRIEKLATSKYDKHVLSSVCQRQDHVCKMEATACNVDRTLVHVFAKLRDHSAVRNYVNGERESIDGS